jgi:hypothetical protein
MRSRNQPAVQGSERGEPGERSAKVAVADRALSRLLKGEWPRTLAELEELKAARRG